MSDSYFGLDTDLPTLGAMKFDEELLTADVEEEYDALNDETFGDGAVEEGDWEENHEKLAHLIDKLKDNPQEKINSHELLFPDFNLEDDGHNEIVEKSLSQLGLEDDLDDPVIKAMGRPVTTTSSKTHPLDRIFGPSPPPPAILDTELSGSPKTCSIWSTSKSSTPIKDTERSSLYKSPPFNSQENSHQNATQISSFCGDTLPIPSSYFLNARTVEDLERDLLTTIPASNPTPLPSTQWKSSNITNERFEKSALHNDSRFTSDFHDRPVSYSPSETWISQSTDRLYSDHSQDKHCMNDWESHFTSSSLSGRNASHDGEKNSLEHKNEIEEDEHNVGVKRSLLSGGTSVGRPVPCSVGTYHATHVVPPVNPLRSPPQRASTPNRASLSSNLPPHPILNPRPLVNPFAIRVPRNMPLPLSHHKHYPALLINNTNNRMVDFRRMMLYPRQIHHPLLSRQQKNLWNLQNRSFNKRCDHDYRKDSDEYSGLMTQKEKEWLIKIQMLQLQTNDPYLDDYYFTTYNTKKLSRKIMNSSNSTKDGPKLLLPERIKQEPRTYVPTQFEKSLGKLQVISVNYPRKVLDISVSRPLEDDEGRIVTNQSLLRYRRLLLDIEKLYSVLLEIDDEEKRMLSLPEDAQEPHKKIRDCLIEELFSGFYSSGSGNDEKFQHIMSVRKGRTLLMRALLVLTRLQQVTLLNLMFQCLSPILRKDQNDRILLQNYQLIMDIINNVTFAEFVDLGEILENLPKEKLGLKSEKSHYIAALKNKSGSTIVCCMLQRGEYIYSAQSSLDPELQARWTRVVLHIVDILCSLSNDIIVGPVVPLTDLLTHFQRFPIERDKFEILKLKLSILQQDFKAGGDASDNIRRNVE